MRALGQLVSQANGRGLLKTRDNHIFEFTRRDQNLHVRGHTSLFTDNGSLGHVENLVQGADMVESDRQILWRLVVDFECDDGQLPPIDWTRDRERARGVASSNANTRTQLLTPSKVRAPNPTPLRDIRRIRAPDARAGVDEVGREGGARRRHPLARNAVVDNGQTLQKQSVAAGAGTGRTPCAELIRPDPIGNGADVQRSARISEINCAAATMSTIESTAPTS